MFHNTVFKQFYLTDKSPIDKIIENVNISYHFCRGRNYRC